MKLATAIARPDTGGAPAAATADAVDVESVTVFLITIDRTASWYVIGFDQGEAGTPGSCHAARRA
jgi:hypothetical protein